MRVAHGEGMLFYTRNVHPVNVKQRCAKSPETLPAPNAKSVLAPCTSGLKAGVYEPRMFSSKRGARNIVQEKPTEHIRTISYVLLIQPLKNIFQVSVFTY